MKVTNYQSATIDPFGKGLGMVPGVSVHLVDAARLDWNLLDEDVSLPAAVLYADRIEHNLKWMQAFVAEYGVKLAPHGKTTMAPQLFRRQLEAGAWGITLATAHQVRAAYRGGVQRVLMANQLVGKRNMGMIAELLTDPNFEFHCLVDSADNVDQLGAFFSDVNKHVNVLLELGVAGGRTGIRDDAQRDAVLAAIARWPDAVKLTGVELYEGVLQDESKVRAFLQNAVDVTRALVADGKIERKPAILSGAGSAWYDVVADEFAKANSDAIEVDPASGLLSDARRGRVQESAERDFRAQSDREENGRRVETGAAIVGLRAVDSGAGSRDHRPGQTRCRVRRRHARTRAPLPSRHAMAARHRKRTKAGKSSA